MEVLFEAEEGCLGPSCCSQTKTQNSGEYRLVKGAVALALHRWAAIDFTIMGAALSS